MIDQLISAIEDLPSIVQGVLGSAIFLVLLKVGDKITVYVSTKFQFHSNERERSILFNDILRLKAVRDGNEIETGAYYASILWVRASRHVIRGFIWLTLGLIFGSIISIFGIVGYLGCLYYMFMALNVVKPVNFNGDIDKKINELETKRNNLENT